MGSVRVDWELSSMTIKAILQWKITGKFAIQGHGVDGLPVILRQHRGLLIGGHLSAALVEISRLVEGVYMSLAPVS